MFSTVLYSFYPYWSIGPLVVYTLASIVVCFYIFKYKTSRTLVEYSALVGALAGFIYNTMIMASSVEAAGDNYLVTVNSSCTLFYAIYLAFAFVPGLIAFGRISRHRSNKFGKYTVYFGYLWSATMVIVGLTITIITSRSDELLESEGKMKHLVNLFLFLYYANWGFIPIFLVLHGIYFNEIKGKARGTLIVYTSLILLSYIVNISITSSNFANYTEFVTKTFAVLLTLCDIPVAIVFIIAAIFGHLWNTEILNHNDKVELHSDDSRVSAEESNKREEDY